MDKEEKKFELDTSREKFYKVINGCRVSFLNPEKEDDARKRLFEFGIRNAGMEIRKEDALD